MFLTSNKKEWRRKLVDLFRLFFTVFISFSAHLIPIKFPEAPIFIESKKTKKGLCEIVQQLQGAISVFDYCNSVIKAHWGVEYTVQNFEQRFISCGSHAHKKSGSNSCADGDPTDVRNPLKIKNHTVAYGQLIRKR